MLYYNGETYVGTFVDGLPHGNGKLILADSSVLEGRWIDGILEGKVEMSLKDNDHPDNSWAITVDEEGVVQRGSAGSDTEYLLPPCLPTFQFQ